MGKLKQWWTRTGALAREIVAKRVTISTTIGTVLGVLVSADVIPTTWSDETTKYVGLGLTLLGVLVGASWARAGVTPADPALAPKVSDVYVPFPSTVTLVDSDGSILAHARARSESIMSSVADRSGGTYDPQHDVEDDSTEVIDASGGV